MQHSGGANAGGVRRSAEHLSLRRHYPDQVHRVHRTRCLRPRGLPLGSGRFSASRTGDATVFAHGALFSVPILSRFRIYPSGRRRACRRRIPFGLSLAVTAMRPIHFLAISVLGTVLASTCALCDAVTNSCEIAAAEVLAMTFESEVEAAHALSERYRSCRRRKTSNMSARYMRCQTAASARPSVAAVRRTTGFDSRFRACRGNAGCVVAHARHRWPFTSVLLRGRRGDRATHGTAVLPRDRRRRPARAGSRDCEQAVARLPGSTVRVRPGAFRGRPVAVLDR